MVADLLVVMISVFLLAVRVNSYEAGDRISTQIRTSHEDMQTSFIDIPINKMPRFKVPDSQLIEISLPKLANSEVEKKLNPKEDLKMSIAFANSKLFIPWTLLFDASERKSLRQLIVTFEYTEYEVLRLQFELKCMK
jgi:hypothetical protein